MLQDNKLHPATWVQATLLAELAEQAIDVGGVYVPPLNKRSVVQGLFGDDTIVKERALSYSWANRGQDGTYIPGSIFHCRVTRPIVAYLFQELIGNRRMKAGYIRAILRKHIRKLSQPPNEPPKEQNIEDIFILYEKYFPKFDASKYPSERQREEGRDVDRSPVQVSSGKQGAVSAAPAELADDFMLERSASDQCPSPPLKSKRNPLLDYIN